MISRPYFTRSLVRLVNISMIAAASLYLSACSSSDDGPATPDGSSDPTAVAPGEPPIIIVPVVELEPEVFTPPAEVSLDLYDTLAATGSFTRLLALLDKAGIADSLKGSEVLTLFAPTDDAFADLDVAIGQGVVDTFTVAELVDRLLYHTVPGIALDSTALRDIADMALATGNELPAAISINANGELMINNATLTSEDNPASNGIYHVIDNVLTPPIRITDPNDNIPPPTTTDISSLLLELSDYSALLGFIEQAGMTEMLQQDNGGLGWTLFAPSDDAFRQAGLDGIELDMAGAMQLVNLHLYPGVLPTAEMVDGELAMSEGTVEISRDAETGLSVGGARIVGRDRVVGNGIMHYVDKPLTASGS